MTFICGLMFCPGPVRAVTELRRVLKPGGRFALAVWDEPGKNTFFTTIPRAAAPFISASAPDPRAPSAFRLAPPGELEAVPRAAGLADFTLDSLPMSFEFSSPAEYWDLFTPMAVAVRATCTLSAADSVRLRESVRLAAEPDCENGRLRLPATALCACGRKEPLE